MLVVCACRKVCSLCECPLALTSANFSASQSTLAVEEFANLHPRYKYYHSGVECSALFNKLLSMFSVQNRNGENLPTYLKDFLVKR
jgi:hypothetical protein